MSSESTIAPVAHDQQNDRALSRTSRQSLFWAGVRSIVPILVGVFPFATIAGITMVSVGIPPAAAMAMSVIVFAGAAQLAAANLIGQGAPVLIIVATALIINLRFLMYSASIAPHFTRLRQRWKWPLAYLLTDQAYAVSILAFGQEVTSANKHWFYLGAALGLWVTWQAGTVVGVLVGMKVPPSWGLDFAIPLTFLAILLPNLKDLSSLAAALAAGVVSTLAFDLPLNSAILVAAFIGIGVGFALESCLEKGKRG
jgi:4-azaleucine resistance transporter AzlC